MQGAANVRCSQCQHVTPVAAPPGPTPPTSAPPTSAPPGGPPQQQGQAPRAQLQCAGCQIMLMYPRGAANVQCAVCGVVSSAAQVQTPYYQPWGPMGPTVHRITEPLTCFRGTYRGSGMGAELHMAPLDSEKLELVPRATHVTHITWAQHTQQMAVCDAGEHSRAPTVHGMQNVANVLLWSPQREVCGL